MEGNATEISQPQVDWFTGNVINPAFNELVASPANVLIEAANAISKKEKEKDCWQKIERRATSQAQEGSLEFWTQTAVEGVSSAIIYVAAGKVAGGLSRSVAVQHMEGLARLPVFDSGSFSMVGTGLKSGANLLAKEQVQQIAGAAAYDYARDPGQGQTRAGDMLGSAAAFSVYGLANPRLVGLSLLPRMMAHFNVGALGSAAQLAGGALGGNSISPDTISQTLATGGFMNLALPGMQRVLGKTIDLANAHIDRGVPLERQMQYADLNGQSAQLDSLVKSNAVVRVHETANGNFEDHQRNSISLSTSQKDKIAYGEQLGHALSHIQSARWKLQEDFFKKASAALENGNHDESWRQFKQARRNDQGQAILTGADIRRQLEKSLGVDSQMADPQDLESALSNIEQEVIPATGKTYEQSWRDEFDNSFVPSKGKYRPRYDFAAVGGDAASTSIKHLTDVFQQAGYFADPRQIVQVSASLDAKPVGGAFLFGKAGSGKTFLTEITAKALDAEYFYKQAFPGTREDNLLVDILPDSNSVSGVKEYPGVLVQAADFLKKNPNRTAVVVLDEWDKTRPSADSILLAFLQSGKINHGSVDIQLTPEQMSRMKVFIAMNDERELSEPLLRRLPLIEFKQPDVNTVRRSLEFSHGEHELIPALLSLYQHSQVAQMSKPVTIQELRQVIGAYDSIKKQGVKPDWDDLIRNFVTKTEENHVLLKNAEFSPIPGPSNEPALKLDPTAYQYKDPAGGQVAEAPAALPSLQKLRRIDFTPKITGFQDKLDETTAGIIAYTDDNYNKTVHLATAPADDPSKIGDIARVVTDDAGKVIVFNNPVPLNRSGRFLARFWGQPGELSVKEPNATWQRIKQLQKKGLQITEFSTDRIVGKAPGADLLWTKDAGAEFVVKLDKGDDEDNPLTGLGLNDWYGEDGALKLLTRYRTREGSYEFPLGRGLPPARIETSRTSHGTYGYEVRVNLYLPAKDGDLIPELQFGKEVTVGLEPMESDWGYRGPTPAERYADYQSIGKTWEDATNDALQKAHKDLVKIMVARRQHLRSITPEPEPIPIPAPAPAVVNPSTPWGNVGAMSQAL